MIDEIISVMDIVSAKMTNTIPTNVSGNCDDEKITYKIYSSILHAFLLAITLLFIINIFCY